MKSLIRQISIALGLISLTACFPETLHPLSSPEDSIVDRDLIGMWYGGPEDEPSDQAYYAFLSVEDTDIDVVGLNFDDDGDEWIRLRLHTTDIEGAYFMSFTFEDESGDDEDEGDGEGVEPDEDVGDKLFFLCRYEFTEDRKLKIYLLNEETLKDILKSMWQGEGPPLDWIDNSGTVIAPTEVLRRAVKGADLDLLFDDVIGVYERIS